MSGWNVERKVSKEQSIFIVAGSPCKQQTPASSCNAAGKARQRPEGMACSTVIMSIAVEE
jgi:hypothetical protein